MNSQNKTVKLIYVFMMLAYLLNMSGARNPLVAKFITPLLPFKCAGHGCACDLAGKELPGCGCFGETEESSPESQGCSVESSCCSSKKPSSKKNKKAIEDDTLDDIGCDGKTNSQYETLDRHCSFDFKTKTLITIQTLYQGKINLLSQTELHSWKLDKIPIKNFS